MRDCSYLVAETLRVSRSPDPARISYLYVAGKLVPCLLHLSERKLPHAQHLLSKTHRECNSRSEGDEANGGGNRCGICRQGPRGRPSAAGNSDTRHSRQHKRRSEEHTSELQS